MSEETPVAIFWDIDRIPLPSESPTYEIVNKITDKAHEDGFIVMFKAYSDVPELVNGGSARYDLQAAGVSSVGCAQDGTKNVTISTDMLVYAMDHPAPATLVVISDDNQLTYVCSILRMRKYRVVVISSSHGGHLMKRRASVLIDWSELMGTISEDEDSELFSRLVQSAGDDASDAASTSNLSRGSPSEVVSPVSHMKTDARSSLRASSGNSDVSSRSSTTLGPEPTENTCPNNLHCSTYPACHCARWHEAEDVVADRASVGELPLPIETMLYRTRSLSLPHRSPQNDSPPPIEPFVTTSKPEEKASITKGQIAMISLSDSNSPPATKPLQAPETAAALTLPTEQGIKTQLPDTATAPNPSPFRNLVEELRRWPIPRPNRIAIAAAMGNRHPLACANAGCANFDEYFAGAMEAGIVNLGETISPDLVTQWISLNQDTKPRQSVSSPAGSALGALSPPREIPPKITGRFKSLIAILQQEGNSCLEYSRATTGLMERVPKAFVKGGIVGASVGGFARYVTLAEEAGVVTVSEGGAPGDRIKWISLNPTLRLSGASMDSPMSAMAAGKEPPSIPESFLPLVERLREMRDNNIAQPFRWPVNAALITKNPSIYSEVGVVDFSEYAKNAELAGIVTLGGEGQREWIALAVN
ncbi:hypothetical protein FIBSPDRAFT_1045141 [Athelia psychrophila]|uniref:NYN domain-containing protein n=1 Tax=Athelia psychrophila TaxID=1759441 RepID=A0A166IQR1_9AGAM|nr:hypothetical protein FIBSPDRAFT_1045141 [Fibularhizoctonia sp. CBS 109695]